MLLGYTTMTSSMARWERATINIAALWDTGEKTETPEKNQGMLEQLRRLTSPDNFYHLCVRIPKSPLPVAID